MKNKNLIQFKKLKKNRAGLSIFFNLILIIMVLVIVSVGVAAISFSTIKSKMMGEYVSLHGLASIYEEGLKQGDENIYDLMDASGRDYILLDSDGDIIKQNGENTCTMDGGLSVFFAEEMVIYGDSEKNLIIRDDDGEVTVDFGMILRDLWREAFTFRKTADSYVTMGIEERQPGISVDIKTNDDTDVSDGDKILSQDEIIELTKEIGRWNTGIVSYPLWCALSVNDGKEQLIGKLSINMDKSDALIVMLLAVLLEIMAVIVLIIGIIRIIRNVMRQKKILNLYMTDPITGGNNWSYFIIKGESFLRKGSNRSKSFAVIELVFIKYRNFCMCHSVAEGEEVVEKIYDIIKMGLGKKDIVAHLTHAEYAILTEYRDEEELKGRLRKLLAVLENIDGSHKFAFHIGVDMIPAVKNERGRFIKRKNLNLETDYNNACTARATLESSDDSRIAFYGEKMLKEQMWLDQVGELQQKALDNEEFKVYYQPKYEPSTGKLKGAEALIRWQSPELGFVSPGRFIPIFENNGFITKIDHYMISHVAKDQKDWLDQGMDCVPVSVNVSRAHFIEKDLADQIRNMVDNAGAPRRLIEIELTESAFFDDKAAMIETINKLKSYGFAVSMDDFGSGYSSLNSLKDMPLDVLKLDAEFFRGENAGERGEIVVSEAIKLGKQLNMRIVAEGVEDRSQVDFLAEKGCDMIQGFIFDKPIAKGEFIDRLKTGVAKNNG